jgi:hypothetical protein
VSHRPLPLSGSRPAVRACRLVAGVLVIVLPLIAATPADAQAPTQRRPRGYRGLFGSSPASDPSRTRQEFTLTVAILGGYDDNLAAAAVGGGGGGGLPQPGQTQTSGYLGQGQLDARYYRGRQERWFAVGGNAYGVSYGDAGPGVSSGGGVNLSGATRLRQRDTLLVTQTLNNDPLFSLGSLAVLTPVVGSTPLPGSNTATGLIERRSWSSQSLVDYSLLTSRSNVMNFNYRYGARRYPESADLPGDADTHGASASISRSLSRRASVRGSYGFSRGEYQDAGGTRPLTQHTVAGGPQFEKVFSRTRRLQLSAAVGANYTKTLSSLALNRELVDYWTPYGETSLQFDASRAWDLNLHYRRGTTVMPEVTTESFVTDAVSLGAGGVVGSRLEVDLSAGISNGTTAAAAGGQAGNRTFVWTSQFRWAFSRSIAASVDYNYYDYKFTGTTDLPTGFPASLSRNTVRVGVTFWLPLVGNYVAEGRGGRTP